MFGVKASTMLLNFRWSSSEEIQQGVYWSVKKKTWHFHDFQIDLPQNSMTFLQLKRGVAEGNSLQKHSTLILKLTIWQRERALWPKRSFSRTGKKIPWHFHDFHDFQVQKTPCVTLSLWPRGLQTWPSERALGERMWNPPLASTHAYFPGHTPPHSEPVMRACRGESGQCGSVPLANICVRACTV